MAVEQLDNTQPSKQHKVVTTSSYHAHHYILFSLGLECRFFIGLIAPHDCRPNLYVRQANFYVRQYGGMIIQIYKNKSVFLLLFTFRVLEKINHLLGLLLTVHDYMLGC